MSRRRAADGPPLDDDNALLPPPPAAAGPTKARAPAARLLRFITTRPVTALLVLIVTGAATFLLLALSRVLLVFVASRTAVVAPHDTHVVAPAHNASAAAPPAEGEAPGPACVRLLPAGRFGSIGALCVTDEYFMDVTIGTTPAGRITIGVFGRAVPKSAANFRALITCAAPFNDGTCFRGDTFHRVVRGFVIQGGSKATGRSIFGSTFREEQAPDHHSLLSHSEPGALAYAEYPIGSQFYILLGKEARYLDKNHVVFAYVADGMDVVRAVEKSALAGERPVHKVSIVDCGELHKE